MPKTKTGQKRLPKKHSLAQQTRQGRLKEIYSYFRQQLNKINRQTSSYFTPHLDLEPWLKKELAKKQKQHPEYDFYAEFRKNKKNLTYKLNKKGQTHLLRQTQQAYREEVAERRNQIKYWQEKAGLTKVQATTLVKRGQKIKLFFPEKGEHKEFWKRNKEFKKLWQEISQRQGSIKESSEIASLSKTLYQKSPWRIRDRFLQAPKQVGGYLTFEGQEGQTVIHKEKPPSSDWNMKEVWDKYYKNNPFEPTKKHYRQAIWELLRQGSPPQELVPTEELDLDKYGQPRLKEGRVISFSSNRPGRRWTIYKKATDWYEVEKKQIHEVAHQGYIEEYGSELEIQTWKQKKNKALCWVEAMGLGNCSAQVGTSNWWCLECIYYGPYHPPVLPKHCQWEYTYRKDVCGSKKHADANKQWHFSSEGEKKRDWIKGGDWGSCHVGTFGKPRKGKVWKKK